MQPRGTPPVSRDLSRYGRSLRRLPYLLLPLLGLACAQQDAADPVVVLQEALASHQASLAGIAPRPAAAGGEGSVAPLSPPARAAPPAASGAVALGTSATLPTMAGQLVGHPPAAVTAWLGAPRLRREEGHAEIWHYQGPQCHLDLFFYRDDAAGSVLRVAFAAARAIGTARRGEAACLRDIARGAGAAPEGPAAAPTPGA